MGCRTSGYGDWADYSGTVSYRVQQEKPDGSLWSVSFWIDESPVFASRRFFSTEAEASAYGEQQLLARA